MISAKDEMIIRFKDGKEIGVSLELAESIQNGISKGATMWRSFQDSNGKLFFIVNITEIVYITKNNNNE